MSQGNEVQRYAANERWNHWLTAITFVLLAASGLAFFHPTFWSLSAVLGGGELSRMLHPIIGVVMFASFMIFAIQKFSDNVMRSYDWKWLGQIGDVLANRDDRLPAVGKYNAGQKLAYWAMLLTMLALMLAASSSGGSISRICLRLIRFGSQPWSMPWRVRC